MLRYPAQSVFTANTGLMDSIRWDWATRSFAWILPVAVRKDLPWAAGIDSKTVMWIYAAVFLSAFAFDVIPIIAPPAWTAMLVLLVKFHLNPWLVVPVGVAGSTLGRYVTGLYLVKFAHRFAKPSIKEDLKFLGGKLRQRLWRSWRFVFLYTLTPLSTTVFFLAAGMAKVKPLHTLPPYFCGKLVSDAAMIGAGLYATKNVMAILNGTFSMKGVLSMGLGLLLVGGFLAVDWRAWLQRKQFKFNLKLWK